MIQRFHRAGHGVFQILRTAFLSLLAHQNLYAPHAGLDYFRYSPTFALVFGPLAVLPVHVGWVIWTLCNTFGLYFIIGRLLPARPAMLVRLIVLADLVRSLQSSQSNALVTTLIVIAFMAYEREEAARGAWAVAGGAFIKLFPIGAGLFALIRPFRRRAVLAIVLACLVFLLAPLLVLSPHELVQQYRWWSGVEAAEVVKPMYSVMDLADAWTGTYWRRWPFQVAGLVLLLVPVALRRDKWEDAGWRLRLLSSVLVFCLLFNHGAESPSFVIALTGVAIWWVMTPRRASHNVLLILTLLVTTIGRSSVTPDYIRLDVIDAARLMVVPLLSAWILMQVELLRGEHRLLYEAAEPNVAALQATA